MNLPFSKDFSDGVKAAKQSIDTARTKAWAIEKKRLEELFTLTGLPVGSKEREMALAMSETIWRSGFSNGAIESTRYMMREMGLGPIADNMETLFDLSTITSSPNPENN